MSTTLAAEWRVNEPRLRVAEGDARAALRAIEGRPVVSARARLRFGPGRTCEQVARLLDRAIVQAENAGLDPKMLVVADGSAQAAEDIIRVRRKAHGVADWIHSPTCRVAIVLWPPASTPRSARMRSSRPDPPSRPGRLSTPMPPMLPRHLRMSPPRRPGRTPPPCARRCSTSSTPTSA